MQTIEFTAADANSELPPPMSVQEVENMTLAQKRMAAMIMEDTSGDVEALRAQQAAAEAEAAAAVGGVGVADDDAAMDQSDDEDEGAIARRKHDIEEREREMERARAIQASSINTAGPMKIRTDYVPRRESYRIFISLLLTFHCSRRQEGRNIDDMYYLWPANSGRRIGRAHAYRVARSQVEIAARHPRGSQSTGFRIATRSQRRLVPQKSRAQSC